jgi:hypothetical protein
VVVWRREAEADSSTEAPGLAEKAVLHTSVERRGVVHAREMTAFAGKAGGDWSEARTAI